jgi:hypothetical protein
MQPARQTETVERKESEHSESPRMLSKVTNHEQESTLRDLQMRMILGYGERMAPGLGFELPQ